MAKRIITAAIAVPLVLAVLLLDNSLLIVIAMAVASVLATYEILIATKYLKNKAITATCLIFVAAAPFALSYTEVHPFVPLICLIFLIVLFTIMVAMNTTVKFQEVAVMAFVSICVPLALSSIAFTQIKFEQHGVFYMMFILGTAWVGDGGAYFAGTFFGKHKMAPSISPKKTWEGFVGGILASGFFAVLLSYGYMLLDNLMTGKNNFSVNVLFLFALALICSVLGVLGDLTASLIKRQCAVKDFGNIIPGHGGVLDRFDSVLFVAPLVYVIFKFYEPVSAII